MTQNAQKESSGTPTVNKVRRLLHASTLELSKQRGLQYGYVRKMCRYPLDERGDFIGPLLDIAEGRARDLAEALEILVGVRQKLMDLMAGERRRLRTVRSGLRAAQKALDRIKEVSHAESRRPCSTANADHGSDT